MDFPIVAHPDKFGIKVFGAGSAITHIQARNLRHLIIGQFKIPDIDIILNPVQVR